MSFLPPALYAVGMNASDVTLIFATDVSHSELSDYGAGVLVENAASSANPVIQIDSLTRTPAQQALAMFHNLEAHGVANQRALYTNHHTVPPTPLPGCKVIDTYEQSKRDGHPAGDIVQDMADTIVAIGPEHVSAHCGDPKKKEVIDVLRSKLKNPLDFIARLRSDKRVSKVLDESFNSCVHCEIPAVPVV